MTEHPLLRAIRWLTDGALAVTVIATSIAIIAQVIYRFVLRDPVTWLDEFAGLIFAWMTLIGAAVVQRTDSHMSVDVFARLMPAPVQAGLYALRTAVMLALLGLLFWQGWALTARMSFIEYPAMEVSRGFLFAILPVGAPLIAFYVVTSALRTLKRIRQGEAAFGDVKHAEQQNVADQL